MTVCVFHPFRRAGIDASVTHNIFSIFNVCELPVQIRVTADMSDAVDNFLVKLTGISVTPTWLN